MSPFICFITSKKKKHTHIACVRERERDKKRARARERKEDSERNGTRKKCKLDFYSHLLICLDI